MMRRAIETVGGVLLLCMACAPRSANLGDEEVGGTSALGGSGAALGSDLGQAGTEPGFGGSASAIGGSVQGQGGLQQAFGGSALAAGGSDQGGTPQSGGGSAATVGGSAPAAGGAFASAPELLTDAESSNVVKSGGHVWTFVARSGTSVVMPDTGKIYPSNPSSTALNPPLDQTNGMELDVEGNRAFHVKGIVGTTPAYPYGGPEFSDRYWDLLYAAVVCSADGCSAVAFPEAGIGLTLRRNSQTTDLSQYLGVGFRIRAGATHGSDTTGAPRLIRVEAPMDLTDVPDPSLGDEFGLLQSGARGLPPTVG